MAIGAAPTTFTPTALLGFAFAAGSALVWACYSLLTRRVAPFLVVGDRRLSRLRPACWRWCCISCSRRRRNCALATCGCLLLLGLGPMGVAFYLWDFAMKRGDPRVIGVLAYATPLLSTALLVSW